MSVALLLVWLCWKPPCALFVLETPVRCCTPAAAAMIQHSPLSCFLRAGSQHRGLRLPGLQRPPVLQPASSQQLTAAARRQQGRGGSQVHRLAGNLQLQATTGQQQGVQVGGGDGMARPYDSERANADATKLLKKAKAYSDKYPAINILVRITLPGKNTRSDSRCAAFPQLSSAYISAVGSPSACITRYWLAECAHYACLSSGFACLSQAAVLAACGMCLAHYLQYQCPPELQQGWSLWA